MNHTIYFNQLSKLLQYERDEELSKNQEYLRNNSIQDRILDGYTWYPLKIEDEGYGLGDTPFLEIERTKNLEIDHQFSGGSTVQLFSNHKNSEEEYTCKGQVQFVNGNRMKIFLNTDEHPDWLELGKLGINILVDETSYKEMDKTLKNLIKLEKEELPELFNFLFNNQKNERNSIAIEDNPSLNEIQNQVIQELISIDKCGIIFGPPGTGKTTTIVAYAKEQRKQLDSPLLITAPSNAATDHLVKKFHQDGQKVVRIGNISRIDEAVVNNTIDALVKNHDDYKYIKKIKRNASELRKMALQYKRKFGHEERQQRKLVLQQAKEMMKDANLMEDSIIEDILSKTDVICTTLVGANHRYIRNKTFEVAIIDEAGQAIEPASWIPISKCDKVVLAGDPFQLPPTVKSNKAEAEGLNQTLLEKLNTNSDISFSLQVQYRMNEQIMEFSNMQFYNGKLVAHDSVKNQSIDQFPIEFIDTAGCGFDEKQDLENKSLSNPEEWKIIKGHLSTLPDYVNDIGIISPYRQQVKYIEEFEKRFRVNTIDSFQGQEADVIYISLVRSNERNEIGFLKDYRRMNVAMTRAKKKLVIIGDSATIGSDKFYKAFIDYCEMIGAYKSAWEWIEL